VGREVLSSGSPKFSGNIYFQSFICKLDKRILFSCYHCSRSSPPSCQRAKLIKIVKSRGNVTPTLRELHASPRKCQNMCLSMTVRVHTNSSPSCFLTCYTLFISPIQTSSRIFISSWLCCHTITYKIWRPCICIYYTRLNASSCRTSFASLSLCKTNFKTYLFKIF